MPRNSSSESRTKALSSLGSGAETQRSNEILKIAMATSPVARPSGPPRRAGEERSRWPRQGKPA